MIDLFIDLIVEWIEKSDTRFLIEKIKEKDTVWLKKWLEARRLVYEKSKDDKKGN